MRNKFARLIWGIFLLLTAAFVILNNINGFIDIDIFSIIASILALSFIVLCIISSYYSPIPIPLAALYIIYMKPLGLPEVNIWITILAAVLSTIGLAVLLSGKNKKATSSGEKEAGKSPPLQETTPDIPSYLDPRL